MITQDIANRAVAAIHTMLDWEKPKRGVLEGLLGTRFTCLDKVGDWIECVSTDLSDPAIEACRYNEYRRSGDRAASLSFRFAPGAQPSVTEFSKLEEALGAWVGAMDSLPVGAGVRPVDFPLYYREFPPSGRARVSLQHYRDGRVHSVHIEWAP